ncbi:MAG: hypothetical protein K0R05_300 [Anaerocolumna sp.]|jgi:hypothetical protein|nr:hypothetical protein [Anaerocolumna sp.]
MKTKPIRIFINILFILSCLIFLGTIIITMLVKDSISPYDLGEFISTFATIRLICLVFIFIKCHINYFIK